MRFVFSSIFLAHLLLSTACMAVVSPVQAEETPVLSVESAMDQTDGCHHEQKQEPAKAPDASCLNHCLSQATSRAMTDGCTVLPTPALPVPLITDLPAPTSFAVPEAGSDFHPSPPIPGTVVLLQ
ncbi:MAG: hypothetical protein PHO54_04225 [Candidatus Peribacteraceae bacterium]|nr:hypothetical protein [Candidatus Peribacteraceae bacterium]